MMLLFATMLLHLSRAVTGAVSRGGEQHAETPLKATKATTTMLLPAATAVCALAEARCCPLEGAAARGGGPHTETPLKATKATKTMLLPAAATAGLRRPRRGRGGALRVVVRLSVTDCRCALGSDPSADAWCASSPLDATGVRGPTVCSDEVERDLVGDACSRSKSLTLMPGSSLTLFVTMFGQFTPLALGVLLLGWAATPASAGNFEGCASTVNGTFFARLVSEEGVCACGSSLAAPLFSLASFAYAELGRVNYSPTGSSVGKSSVALGLVDFGGTDSLVKQETYDAVPDLRLFPILAAAAVPIVNLPELEDAGLRLVLSRELLPLIFMGDIYRWDE
ncbi:hypothetical protein T492DRAFT_882834, partial [Pavlovales sp. CCMP2436]